jgi:hypothetical protein
MRNCPICKTPNEEGVKICQNCGYRFEENTEKTIKKESSIFSNLIIIWVFAQLLGCLTFLIRNYVLPLFNIYVWDNIYISIIISCIYTLINCTSIFPVLAIKNVGLKVTGIIIMILTVTCYMITEINYLISIW